MRFFHFERDIIKKRGPVSQVENKIYAAYKVASKTEFDIEEWVKVVIKLITVA